MLAHVNYFYIHEILAQAVRENSRDLRGAAPLCAILNALDYIIAQIHPAQAQVCANWGLLRRETRLATLIILNVPQYRLL